MKLIKKYKFEIVTFLMAFIPRFIGILFALPLGIRRDELGNLLLPATLAGLDWSGLNSSVGYYGFGFLSIFAPILKFFDSPIIEYRLMLAVLNVIASIPSIFCYKILKNNLGISSKKIACLISVVCSYISISRINVIGNEAMVSLITWLSVYCVCLIYQNRNDIKKRNFIIKILLVLFVYSITIHTRLLIMWGALFIVFMLYSVLYKKMIIPVTILIGIGGIGGVAAEILVKIAQNNVWSTGKTEVLANAEIPLDGIGLLTEPIAWHSWINIFLGQINTITIFTGGLFVLSCAYIFILLKRNFIINRRGIIIKTSTENKEILLIIGLGLFLLLSIVLTICAQSITWLEPVVQGMRFNSKAYGLKAFVYIRYFCNYCGPLIMLLLAYAYKNMDDFLKLFRPVLIIIAILQFFWVTSILPFMYENANMIEVFIPFAGFTPYSDKKVTIGTFLCGTIALFIIFIVIWILFRNSKSVWAFSLIGIIFLYRYGYNTVFYDYDLSYSYYANVSESIELLQKVDDVLPDTIYVWDELERGHNSYLYQYYLKRHTIVPEVPNYDESEAVFISNVPLNYNDLTDKGGFHYAELEQDQYIWIKGSQITQALKDIGLDLLDTAVYTVDIDLNSLFSENNESIEPGYLVSNGKPGHLCFGPYIELESGEYEIKTSLGLSDSIYKTGDQVGRLEIVANNGETLLGSTEIRVPDDKDSFEVSVKAEITEDLYDVEFRIYSDEGAFISLNRMQLSRLGK